MTPRDMDGRAEDRGRVYQSGGDQHISEHHHHHHHDQHGDTPGSPDSVRCPMVGRAPLVLRNRAAVLSRLRDSVAPGRGGEVHVLHGMGGCGKTAVAWALFQFATEQAGRVGLWVNAASRASLRAGMLAVAADRGASDGELLAARNGFRPAADLVWSHLDRSADRWLLVLDNADDPVIFRDGHWLRTSPAGTVLVTTRRSASRWWPGAQLQHIGVLPREDAARVLCDLAPDSGTVEEAADIADRLGRLPLALTLAGGFLAHQIIDPWSMSDYGRQLDQERRVELLDRGAEALAEADPRHLVGRTWQLSLDAFEGAGLPEAATLLRFLARLAPQPLPLDLLGRPEIASVLPAARTETALRALLDHSLTELIEAGANLRCVQSHAVLLDSVAAATPGELRASLDATAGALLDADVPAVPDAGPHDPRLRLLAPHVLTLLRSGAATADLAVRLATRLATALHRTGDYHSAWETARAAGELGTATLGADHRLVLAARSRSGRALFRLGRYAEAEELLRAVHAAQQERFGRNDPDTLDSAHGLQLVLGNLPGRRDEALALLRHTVAGRRQALGAEHPLTLRSRTSLLVHLPAAELADPANSWLLSLPETCAARLGPEHTITLGARHNCAWALFVLGRYEEADAAIRGVAEAYARRFGRDYPHAFSAQQLRARTRAALGDASGSIALLTEVISARERTLGPDHPFTEASRTLLAELNAGTAAG